MYFQSDRRDKQLSAVLYLLLDINVDIELMTVEAVHCSGGSL